MTLILRHACAAALAFGMLPASAASAAEEDQQLWTAVQANVALGDRTVLLADLHYRYSDGMSRLGQNQIRAALGYRLDATTVLAQGYVYVRTDPLTGPTTREHRPFQQLNFRVLGNGKGLTLQGRTRLEQRFVEGQSGVGLRFRQQLRATVPLAPGSKAGVYAVGSGEVMVNFNSAAWGQRRGFDQWRLMAGLGVPLAQGIQIEGGYMNNYIARYRREDRINHNLSLTLSIMR